ncbi:MAG: transposase, partial [bacterium]
AEYVCERLIPPDSFYRKFKEVVTPLIKDEDFDSMYCKDNARPPISPSLLARACILQPYRALSDREMEPACMCDIQDKYALDYKVDFLDGFFSTWTTDELLIKLAKRTRLLIAKSATGRVPADGANIENHKT